MSTGLLPSPGLGRNQAGIMRALGGHYPYHGERPFPGHGWIWNNHSTTVRLLRSLVKHGLVRECQNEWKLTDAGRIWLCRNVSGWADAQRKHDRTLDCGCPIGQVVDEGEHQEGCKEYGKELG